jgi:hypothetical protein
MYDLSDNVISHLGLAMLLHVAILLQAFFFPGQALRYNLPTKFNQVTRTYSILWAWNKAPECQAPPQSNPAPQLVYVRLKWRRQLGFLRGILHTSLSDSSFLVSNHLLVQNYFFYDTDISLLGK